MRRILTAAAAVVLSSSLAMAADMAAPAPAPAYKAPPPAPAVFNWTGCYVGGNIGYGSAHEQWNYGYYAGTDYNQDYGSHRTSGVLGGGQFGCDYQMGVWVVGAEGDFSFTGAKGDHAYSSYFQNTKLDWIATATARIGYAFDNSLIYVKGGAAWDRGSYDMTLSGISYSDKITRSGWTIGGGWEYGFAPHWSVKVEYNYIKFGFHDVWWNYQYASPPDPWSFHVDQAINVVKLGLNYRF